MTSPPLADIDIQTAMMSEHPELCMVAVKHGRSIEEPRDPKNKESPFWTPGSTLRVRFLDGSPEAKAAVRKHAVEWAKYANIFFSFPEYKEDKSGKVVEASDIRVTFEGQGNDTSVGCFGLVRNAIYQTMQLGEVRTIEKDSPQIRATILHEFGHALGLYHEHQNPNRNFKFHETELRDYYTGWTHEMVDANIIKAYTHEQANATPFDRLSIMNYPIPDKLIKNKKKTGISELNTELSPTDKTYIGRLYPPAPARAAKKV